MRWGRFLLYGFISYLSLMIAWEAGSLLLTEIELNQASLTEVPKLSERDEALQQLAVWKRLVVGKESESATHRYDLAQGYLKVAQQYRDKPRQYLSLLIETLKHNGEAVHLNPSAADHHLMQAWTVGNVGFTLQGRYLDESRKFPGDNLQEVAYREFFRALRLSPYDAYGYRLFGLWSFERARRLRAHLDTVSANSALYETRCESDTSHKAEWRSHERNEKRLFQEFSCLGIKNYHRAVKLNPTLRTEFFSHLFQLTLDYEVLKKFILKDANDYYLFGQFLVKKGLNEAGKREIRAAMDMIQRHLARSPGDAASHFTLGDWAFYGLGDRTLGIRETKIALDLEPENIRWRYWYGKMLFYTRRFEEAPNEFKHVLQNDPKDDRAHFWLGRSYEKVGKIELAKYEYRKAVRLNPMDSNYRHHLNRLMTTNSLLDGS